MAGSPLALRSSHDGLCVLRSPSPRFGPCTEVADLALFMPEADDHASLIAVASPSISPMPGEFRHLFLGPSQSVCAERWCVRCISRTAAGVRARVGLCAYHGFEPLQLIAVQRGAGARSALLPEALLPSGEDDPATAWHPAYAALALAAVLRHAALSY